MYIHIPSNYQKVSVLLVLSKLSSSIDLTIGEIKNKGHKLYCKITSYHGCSSGIRKKMFDKGHSQIIWCYNKHIKGKQCKVCRGESGAVKSLPHLVRKSHHQLFHTPIKN